MHIGCIFDMTYATLLWVFFLNRKCILLKKFRFYIYWESLHTEMQILDVNQIYQTKNWAECFSNQDLNEISAFSYLRGPRPWYQGKPWVHYTQGASAQWTPAWFLNKDKSWIKHVEWNNDTELCVSKTEMEKLFMNKT